MRISIPTLAAAAAIALAPAVAEAQIGVEVLADGFEQPVFVSAPAGDERIFVVDQPGQIFVIENGEVLETPFLDIRSDVSFGGEQGLLGLAFHPRYAENGRFFVNYTNNDGDTRVVEFRASSAPNQAAPSTAKTIIGFDQPAGNHNGGWIGFGPDSYLYIAAGDGGGANDRFGNGQNPDSLLGKMLRLDVDRGEPYAIPQGNPWADGGGVPEAFIYGLSNPWRATFDEHDLIIADVGQNQWEEISVVSIADAGANLGWPIMEGNHCFQANSCDEERLVLPVYEYSHDEGCSVTGGYVYRSGAIPEVRGHYFFSDYCTGFLRSFRYEDGEAVDVMSWTSEVGDLGRVLSFGFDASGEIYITNNRGEVLKIVAQ